MLDSYEVKNLSQAWLEIAGDTAFSLRARKEAKKQARELSRLYVLI